MSQTLRWILILTAVAAIGGAAAAGLYWASQWVPPFYHDALAMHASDARHGSDLTIRDATALSNSLRKAGTWQATFAAGELNGWLAVDLPENHPDALPAAFHDLRVAITPRAIVLACRTRWAHIPMVVWLTLEPYLAEPNVLAIRFRKIRAGRIPLPLKQILEAIDHGIRDTELRIQWRQADGDPVALISWPHPPGSKSPHVQIATLQMGDGTLLLAGSTDVGTPGADDKKTAQ